VVTDVEMGESGGEVCRVTREEISVDAIQYVINLTNWSDRISLLWLKISHQKCDVPIFEEVFVVSHK